MEILNRQFAGLARHGRQRALPQGTTNRSVQEAFTTEQPSAGPARPVRRADQAERRRQP